METDNSLNSLIGLIESQYPDYVKLLTSESSSEVFESFSLFLADAVKHLEKNANHFNSLSEEALSAIIASKTFPGIRITQEQHSNGHVDLTFQIGLCEPYKIVLGEAKIHSGPQYHIQGLKQLLVRYSTGRESLGAMINYVKQPNIKILMQNIQAEFDRLKPENQIGNTESHSTVQWSFQSQHQHASGENLTVYHIGCNLHVANK